MWQFPTSMSTTPNPAPSDSTPRPAPIGTSTTVWIVALIVVAAAVGGAGFFAGYEYRGSPAASPAATENSTLSILGAGTLDTLFPQLANELVNQTPGISAPAAAQIYEGSIDITTALLPPTGATADVAAVADYRLIPQLLEPKYASYEVVWGTTPEVLAWNPSSVTGFAGINSTNWPTKLIDTIANGSKPLGVWNASTDPNGYNEIFSMMLQGMLYDGGNVSAVYDHFYSGAPGTVAIPNPKTAILEHESQAALDLSSDVVSAVITYQSYAIVNHLTYVPFDPIVGLLSNSSTALADYASVATSILTATGTQTVHAAPVLFSITVPSNAQNPSLGAAFIHLLLSPAGAAIISEGGAFLPIFPGWCDRPSAAPSVLQPDVVPLPSWAAAILG
jgi:molybdate/tungstate transport system substrate-binding protein